MAKKGFGCGRKECAASTGICGNATFGRGKLDSNGYWEFPCKKCEEHWDKLEEERKLMAKETLQEIGVRRLKARGFIEVKCKSRKYRAFKIPNENRYYFIGKAGAIRVGRNISSSISIGRVKKEIA